MKPNIWIIGGTSEGRNLISALAELDLNIYVSVATEYGAGLIEPLSNVTIMAERINLAAMKDFIKTKTPEYVIDATHPYATVVTATVQQACQDCNCEYLRLVRPALHESGCIVVQDFQEAVELLSHTEGNIFLTTGSKDLQYFTALPQYQNRIALRILPMLDSLSKALELGYKPAQIICMQGPFSETINIEMMKRYQTRYLVTKDSGSIGGVEEKQQAAQKVGARLIVIARSNKENGSGYQEILNLLHSKYTKQ